MDILSQKELSPAKFYSYAEKTNIYRLFQYMMERLVVCQPENPIGFLQQLLKKGFHDAYGIIVLGPPSADRKQVSTALQQRLRLVHLTSENLMRHVDQEMESALEKYTDADEVPGPLWVKLIIARVEKPDCLKRGWILEGLPRTREQAFLMLKNGVFPTHIVILEESEQEEIFGPACMEAYVSKQEATQFRAEKQKLISFFRKANLKRFRLETDSNSLMNKVEDFVREKERSFVPYVPRVILFGPRGSGRRTLASLLSAKYELVIVDFSEILKQASLCGGPNTEDLHTYSTVNEPVPDDLLARVVAERLLRPDCVEKGWVMFDFPFNLIQAQALTALIEGFQVNRAIFLDAKLETCVGRLNPLRIHADSGRLYHLVDDPPPSNVEPEKLLQRPEDTREEIEASYLAYSGNSAALQGYYSRNLADDIVFNINTERSTNEIFEVLDSYVVGPTKRKLPLGEWWEWSSRNTGIV